MAGRTGLRLEDLGLRLLSFFSKQKDFGMIVSCHR